MVGSGYLLDDDLLLTAGHVADFATGGECEVRSLGSERWLRAELVWRGTGDCDAALFQVEEAKQAAQSTPPSLGRIVGNEPVQARATGFAAAQARPSGMRDTEDLRGMIVPLSGRKGGRLTISIEGSVPNELDDGHSLWEGMSGAALFSRGLLVGVVIVAPEHFSSDRLEATSLAQVAEDPDFRATIERRSGRVITLSAVEADGLLDDPYRVEAHMSTHGFASTSMLLHAELAVVPFRGRSSELAELEDWSSAGSGLRVSLLFGKGGTGKSRLAAELCRGRQADGAVAGFLVSGAELDRIRVLSGDVELLVIVDEAHTRYDEVASLLRTLTDAAGQAPVRVLLLARGAGDWWGVQLPILLKEHVEAALALDAANVRSLGPVEESDEGRAEAFISAVHAFAARQDRALPVPLVAPDLAGPAFDAILWVHLAALSAVDGELAPSGEIIRSELIDYALRREVGYWVGTARARNLDVEPAILERAVALATIVGANDEDEASNVLQAVPDLTDSPQIVRPVARWLHELYPRTSNRPGRAEADADGWLPALSPESLGEALIARVLGETHTLPTRLLGLASAAQTNVALTRLTQAARNYGAALGPLQSAIEDHLEDVWSVALVVAQAVGDPLGPMLADALTQKRDPEIAVAISKALPDQTVTLRDLGVVVWQQIVDYLRKQSPSSSDEASLAIALNEQSNWLSDLGRSEDALAAIEEAVSIYRKLAEAATDAFQASLAGSQNNLSNCLAALGDRREDALAAIEESIELYRALAKEAPDSFLEYLAAALNNQSNRLSDLGRQEDALAAIEESIELYRALAKEAPDSFLQDLAAALNNQSNRLSDLERQEDALAASEEAVEIRRALAKARPDAFLPALSMSLNNQTQCLSDLKRHEDALAASEEAVEIRRALAKARPDAFLPDLAGALNNQSNCLGNLGRREDALAAIEEAIEFRRALAEGRPDAFLPDLAMSLSNLSNRLSDLGRREDALAAVEEALHIALPILERGHYFLPDAGLRLGHAYIDRCNKLEREPNEAVLMRLASVLVKSGMPLPDD